MSYNEANRMTAMSGENGEICYHYNTNGNLTEKVYGDLKGTYQYDVCDHLLGVEGYDGSRTTDQYSVTNLLLEKIITGKCGRVTMEELLAGKEAEDGETETHTTTYVYDQLSENAQVLAETTDGKITVYTYGLERAAAFTNVGAEETRIGYAYDVRGSVVQTSDKEDTENIRYTPYGEQILKAREEERSGYLYNGEAYDAMSGSYYLRARYYEPAMMRFNQLDVVRGSLDDPMSLNRYLYVQDNPVMYEDPSGQINVLSFVMAGSGFATAGYKAYQSYTSANPTQAKTVTKVVNSIKANKGVKAITSALKKSPVGKVMVDIGGKVIKVVSNTQAKAVVDAQKALRGMLSSDPEVRMQAQQNFMKACSAYLGNKFVDKGDASKAVTKTNFNLWDGIREIKKDLYQNLNAQQQSILDTYFAEVEEGRKNQRLSDEYYDTLRQEVVRKLISYNGYEYTPTYSMNYNVYQYQTLEEYLSGLPKDEWDSVTFAEDRVIDGVRIPWRKEPYTYAELKNIIATGKSTGKKVDWKLVDQNNLQDLANVNWGMPKWTDPVDKVFGVVVGGAAVIWMGSKLLPIIGTAAAGWSSTMFVLYALSQKEVQDATSWGLNLLSLISGGIPGGSSSQGAVALGKIQGIIVPNVYNNNTLSLEEMLSRQVHFIVRPGKKDTEEGNENKDSSDITASDTYVAPPGGGGTTDSINVDGKTIKFGHGGRHLEETGLDLHTVNKAIADEVSKLNLKKGVFHKGQIVVNDVIIEYTSYGLGNNVINVGTYYPINSK